MKNKSAVSLVASTFMILAFSTKVQAYGIGLSTYPIDVEAKLLSAEFTGITSAGGGIGMQARYTQKLSEKSTVDAGLGIAGGEHSARIFAGYDFEIYPDYQKQPRVSLKGFLENSKEFKSRKNIIGFAPTFSKGFLFWGKEAFPYVSLPYGISLDGSNNSYNSTLSANLGIAGQIPAFAGPDKQLTASAEAIVNLKDSISGVFVGIAYPVE